MRPRNLYFLKSPKLGMTDLKSTAEVFKLCCMLESPEEFKNIEGWVTPELLI